MDKVRFILQAWALWMPRERFVKASALLTKLIHEGKSPEDAAEEAERLTQKKEE